MIVDDVQNKVKIAVLLTKMLDEDYTHVKTPTYIQEFKEKVYKLVFYE